MPTSPHIHYHQCRATALVAIATQDTILKVIAQQVSNTKAIAHNAMTDVFTDVLTMVSAIANGSKSQSQKGSCKPIVGVLPSFSVKGLLNQMAVDQVGLNRFLSKHLAATLSSTVMMLTLGVLCFQHSMIALEPPAINSLSAQNLSVEAIVPLNAPIRPNVAPTPISGNIVPSDTPTAIDTIAPANNADPIGSPYPLPWEWVQNIQTREVSSALPTFFYYRSPALLSPDGAYTAYSRMQIKRIGDPSQSQISSIIFLENAQTGEIQFLTASSLEMQHGLLHGIDSQQPGMLLMLMPISWSEQGDRVLVRAFESIFNTDIAADYAIVWDQASNQMISIVPTNAQYSNAILLGWSQSNPDRVLFRVGNLGDEAWPLINISNSGQTTIVTTDQPIVYGQTTPATWNGPQISAIEATAID